jgi:photosystem II stability/assembly factor-like uncharacterized protein
VFPNSVWEQADSRGIRISISWNFLLTFALKMKKLLYTFQKKYMKIKTFIFIILFVPFGFLNSQNVVVNNLVSGKSIDLMKSGKVIQTIPVVSYDISSLKAKSLNNQANNSQNLNWNLSFTASGKVFKDVSFANSSTGYIVTELGSVYKTTNGGLNWVSKMNLGFPYYWYGVSAITPDTVVIAGFNNQGNIKTGVIRWSFNGGDTWTPDIILTVQSASGVGWLDKIRFINQNTGIAFAANNGAIYYTTNGGKDTLSWNYVQVNSDQGWFAGSVDYQTNGNVYATGIHFAKSTNFGVNWVSMPSADYVFDGGVDFVDYNNLYGFTGGGQISSPVSGWVHRTSNGGNSWSGRLNTFDYPVRALKFFNPNYGFICGGNVYSEAGWIYSTANGGQNWNLEVNTLAEMFSIATVNFGADSTDVWVVGSTGSSTGFVGKAYKTRIGNVSTAVNNNTSETPNGYKLFNVYPNPYNPETTVKFQIPVEASVSLKIFDIQGRLMETLMDKNLQAGYYEVSFKSSNYSSGIYFVRMIANNFSDSKKIMIVK